MIRGGLEHVEQVGGEIRRRDVAVARPEGEPAVAALNFSALRALSAPRGLIFFGVDARQRERLAEIGREQQRQRARAALLGAAVRILDEVARAFAQADHRRRRQLDVQSAEARARRPPGIVSVSSAVAASPRRRPRRFPATRRISTGITSSNASLSSPSAHAHLHARAADALARRRRSATSTEPPAVDLQRLLAVPVNVEHVRIEAA